MHKLIEHIEKLECLQDRLIRHAECLEVKDGCKEELYYFCDMIKDCAEAMEKEAKAKYYKTICEAMKKSEEEEELILKMGIPKEDILKMGYDNWRYSSGRFAPKGKGHYAGGSSGYMPAEDWEDRFRHAEIYDPTRHDMMPMMGYDDGRKDGSSTRGDRSNSGSNSMGYDWNRPGDIRSQYGQSYEQFKNARKHYTENKDKRDKEEMNESAKHHMADMEYTMKDMWKDADPELKKELKASLTSLVNNLPTT